MEGDIHSFNKRYDIMIVPHWLQSHQGRKLLQKSPLVLELTGRATCSEMFETTLRRDGAIGADAAKTSCRNIFIKIYNVPMLQEQKYTFFGDKASTSL